MMPAHFDLSLGARGMWNEKGLGGAGRGDGGEHT